VTPVPAAATGGAMEQQMPRLSAGAGGAAGGAAGGEREGEGARSGTSLPRTSSGARKVSVSRGTLGVDGGGRTAHPAVLQRVSRGTVAVDGRAW
jgi:hypothetical protein